LIYISLKKAFQVDTTEHDLPIFVTHEDNQSRTLFFEHYKQLQMLEHIISPKFLSVGIQLLPEDYLPHLVKELSLFMEQKVQDDSEMAKIQVDETMTLNDILIDKSRSDDAVRDAYLPLSSSVIISIGKALKDDEQREKYQAQADQTVELHRMTRLMPSAQHKSHSRNFIKKVKLLRKPHIESPEIRAFLIPWIKMHLGRGRPGDQKDFMRQLFDMTDAQDLQTLGRVAVVLEGLSDSDAVVNDREYYEKYTNLFNRYAEGLSLDDLVQLEVLLLNRAMATLDLIERTDDREGRRKMNAVLIQLLGMGRAVLPQYSDEVLAAMPPVNRERVIEGVAVVREQVGEVRIREFTERISAWFEKYYYEDHLFSLDGRFPELEALEDERAGLTTVHVADREVIDEDHRIVLERSGSTGVALTKEEYEKSLFDSAKVQEGYRKIMKRRMHALTIAKNQRRTLLRTQRREFQELAWEEVDLLISNLDEGRKNARRQRWFDIQDPNTFASYCSDIVSDRTLRRIHGGIASFGDLLGAKDQLSSFYQFIDQVMHRPKLRYRKRTFSRTSPNLDEQMREMWNHDRAFPVNQDEKVWAYPPDDMKERQENYSAPTEAPWKDSDVWPKVEIKKKEIQDKHIPGIRYQNQIDDEDER